MDIKFSRNKTDNLQSKAQSYSTLVGTHTVTPEDALTIVDLTTDSVEMAAKGKKYWEDVSRETPETIDLTKRNQNQNIDWTTKRNNQAIAAQEAEE